MHRNASVIIFLLLISANFACTAHAKEYETSYSTHYILQDNGDATVTIHTSVTNNKAHTYVSQFSLKFPDTFKIENLSARDNKGDMVINRTDNNHAITIITNFNNPDINSGAKNSFDLTFTQKKLLKMSGNVWELLLPVIRDDQTTDYQIKVTLPHISNKKISLAKPIPESVSNTELIWKNPQTKTIYALFGDAQYYKLNLTYHLKNTRFSVGYYDIALPPDTTYQKIVVDSIDPEPDLTYLDGDGNYMARFTISPQKETQVQFNGFIKVFIDPQNDYKPFADAIRKKNMKNLVSEKNYWSLGTQSQKIPILNKPDEIYGFVTKKLSYDYSRVRKQVERLGADGALINPKNAVCMEFTDLFIALARHAGIPAREDEGFGFSDDSSLRPLSFVSDILHSWPEYYDTQKKMWVQIDPTWGNTSGIDYFNSFDVNHITFAIHGTDSVYPLSAGTYKTENSKDVLVEVVDSIPKAKVTVESDINIKDHIFAGENNSGKIEIKNTGNVFITSSDVIIHSGHTEFTPRRITIDALAPYEKKTYEFSYRAHEVKKQLNDTISFSLNGAEVQSSTISITPIADIMKQFKIASAIGIGFISFILLLLLKKG